MAYNSGPTALEKQNLRLRNKGLASASRLAGDKRTSQGTSDYASVAQNQVAAYQAEYFNEHGKELSGPDAVSYLMSDPKFRRNAEQYANSNKDVLGRILGNRKDNPNYERVVGFENVPGAEAIHDEAGNITNLDATNPSWVGTLKATEKGFLETMMDWLPQTEGQTSEPDDPVIQFSNEDVWNSIQEQTTNRGVDLGLARRIMDRYNNNRLATDPPMKMDQAIAKAQQYRADAGTKSDAERLSAQTALSTNSQQGRGVTGARNQFRDKTLAKATLTAQEKSDTRENEKQRRIEQASMSSGLRKIYTNDKTSTSQIMATKSQLDTLKGTPGYERLKREYDQGIQKSVLSVLRERTDLPTFLEEHIWGVDNETPGINADVEDLAQQLVLSSNGQKVAFRDASGEGIVGEWVGLNTEIPHATLKWIQKHVRKATDPASNHIIKFGSGLPKNKTKVLNGAPITPEKLEAYDLWQKGNK